MCAIAHKELPKDKWVPASEVSSCAVSRGRSVLEQVADDLAVSTLPFLHPSPRLRPSAPLSPPPHSHPTLLHSTQSQDVRYLKPIVTEIEAENAERKAWDHVTKA